VGGHDDGPPAVEFQARRAGAHRGLGDVQHEAVLERRRVDGPRVDSVARRERRLGQRHVLDVGHPAPLFVQRFDDHLAVVAVQRVQEVRPRGRRQLPVVVGVDVAAQLAGQPRDALEVHRVERHLSRPSTPGAKTVLGRVASHHRRAPGRRARSYRIPYHSRPTGPCRDRSRRREPTNGPATGIYSMSK
jgi:hypothetical protein